MKSLVPVICVCAATAVVITCSIDVSCGSKKEFSTVPDKTIEQVLKDNTSKWLAIPGVEGAAIGLCDDRPCIKIFTSIQPEKMDAMIPEAVEDYTAVIEYADSFRTRDR